MLYYPVEASSWLEACISPGIPASSGTKVDAQWVDGGVYKRAWGYYETADIIHYWSTTLRTSGSGNPAYAALSSFTDAYSWVASADFLSWVNGKGFGLNNLTLVRAEYSNETLGSLVQPAGWPSGYGYYTWYLDNGATIIVLVRYEITGPITMVTAGSAIVVPEWDGEGGLVVTSENTVSMSGGVALDDGGLCDYLAEKLGVGEGSVVDYYVSKLMGDSESDLVEVLVDIKSKLGLVVDALKHTESGASVADKIAGAYAAESLFEQRLAEITDAIEGITVSVDTSGVEDKIEALQGALVPVVPGETPTTWPQLVMWLISLLTPDLIHSIIDLLIEYFTDPPSAEVDFTELIAKLEDIRSLLEEIGTATPVGGGSTTLTNELVKAISGLWMPGAPGI